MNRFHVYTDPPRGRDRIQLGTFACYRDAINAARAMWHDHSVPTIVIDTINGLYGPVKFGS